MSTTPWLETLTFEDVTVHCTCLPLVHQVRLVPHHHDDHVTAPLRPHLLHPPLDVQEGLPVCSSAGGGSSSCISADSSIAAGSRDCLSAGGVDGGRSKRLQPCRSGPICLLPGCPPGGNKTAKAP